LRTDRGLHNLGKVADLADTPSLIAVGDQGTLSGRTFEVLGRVQLDQGQGPWDEYYVAFDYGNAWGWLAYAQGRWHVTNLVPQVAAPSWSELQIEQDLDFGSLGVHRVAEIKTGTIRSAEGELPGAFPAGFVRFYADCYGPGAAFATLDYDDGRKPATLFAGFVFAETELQITQAGLRTVNKVKTTYLKCPSCGGDVPKLGGDRSERLGCPYCGAVSDIAERRLISQQEQLRESPTIPIGSRGRFDDVEYLCLAYVKRSSLFEGERYSWEEFLLFAPQVGYRWLVDDPETGWYFASAISPSAVDLRGRPDAVGYLGRAFELRNENEARVDYVLGEVYWKCAVGETVEVTDYAMGDAVLSRELSNGEVNWTYSAQIQWPAIARAFGLSAAKKAGTSPSKSSAGKTVVIVAIILLLVLLLCCMIGAFADDGATSSTNSSNPSNSSTRSSPGVVIIRNSGSSSSYRGGGVFSGGK
jgi:hypothetical protein